MSPFLLQFLIKGPKKITFAFSFQCLDDRSPAGTLEQRKLVGDSFLSSVVVFRELCSVQ